MKALKLIVLTSLATCLLFSGPGLAQETADEDQLHGIMRYYTFAGRAEAGGDNEGARDHLVEGVAAIPSSPHLHVGLARVSLALGDTAGCLAALEKLADLGGVLALDEYAPLAELATLPTFTAVGARLAPITPPPAKITASLNDPDLWTEGIAWDAATGDLLAGSVKLRKLARVRQGVVTDLGTSATDGLLEIIGLDIDVKRRHVWAASGLDLVEEGAKHDFGEAPRDNAIVVYSLETGKQLAQHLRPASADETIHMWNDVSVAPDGTAYFTDMNTSTLWRIKPGGSPEVFRELEQLNYINGLAVGQDGRLLYTVGLEGVAVIDLPEGKERLLDHPDDLCIGLGDGMAVRGQHMFIVQNSPMLGLRILHLKLSTDGYGVEVSEILTCGLPDGLMPYTCALGDGVLYVNGTAPFGEFDNDETPATPVIVELEYGLP
jgi:hypothetical protein